ncbi:hypothetical protein RF11_09408 [Thelohanellus kitauei]|uniref:Uncharacterized protein n=1 Tax=Thelohanellus kitauei TaxID=669202 RepID=A0A0C2J9Y0_THEKT|nr:hypothetical protein RF11_09408 [Thelohanellus kitauei]
MLVAVDYFDVVEIPFCNVKVDPKEEYYEMGQISWLVHRDCTDHFEQWYKANENARMLDMNSCKFSNNDPFFNMKDFLKYVRQKVQDTENYPRMVISVYCNRMNIIEDFYRAKSTYKSTMILINRTNK